nr:MAG TPA: hypothetical protein [Caudoviricetes sp.]
MNSHLPSKKFNSKHRKGYGIIITRYPPFVYPKGGLFYGKFRN